MLVWELFNRPSQMSQANEKSTNIRLLFLAICNPINIIFLRSDPFVRIKWFHPHDIILNWNQCKNTSPPPKNFTMWELFGLPLFNHPNMATFSFVRDRVNPSQPVEGNRKKYIYVYQRILGKYQNPKLQERTFQNFRILVTDRVQYAPIIGVSYKRDCIL